MESFGHWISIHKSDYDTTDMIMKRLYEQGNASSIDVYFDQPDDRILIRIICNWPNWIAVKNMLAKSGVIFQ